MCKKVGKKKESNEDNGMLGDFKYKIFIVVLGKNYINFFLFCVYVIFESLVNMIFCELYEFVLLFLFIFFVWVFIK